ncbi:acetokinase family protein [Hirsutella rhossiliensis]
MKVILAINAGSSSVKVSVYAATSARATPRHLADAQVSGLTAPPARLRYERPPGRPVIEDKEVDGGVGGQDDAFRLLLDTLVDDADLRDVGSEDDVAIACHRIVHGGDYGDAQLITRQTYHHHLERLSDLAPLHNGAALAIVASCIKQLPRAANLACFDSQFHASIPAHISTYPVDPQVARKNRLRKYGFHGISYPFIARSVAEFLDKDLGSLNVIALHLGSGASALVFHYASDAGKLSPASTRDLHISKAEEILNRESGWKCLTGTTDFGVISGSDEARHRLAFDLMVDRICGFVGSYYVSLRGEVDALVFAGGIGGEDTRLRRAVVEATGCLGFALDERRNGASGEGVVQNVGAEGAKHGVLVCRTDEQFEMARMCTAREELWR